MKSLQLSLMTSGLLASALTASTALASDQASIANSIAADHVQYAQCGSLIDPVNKKVVKDVTIKIEGNRFSEVTAGGKVPAGAEVTDLSNATCLPGLFELHAHLTLDRRRTTESVGHQRVESRAHPIAPGAARHAGWLHHDSIDCGMGSLRAGGRS